MGAVHDELVHVALHTAEPESTAGRASLAGIVADLSQPVQVVDADLPLGDVQLVFRDATTPCVVVRGRGGVSSRVGILMRDVYDRVLTGRLGYGRAMLERKPTSTVTDWAPLVVPPGARVTDVAARAMARDGEHRYDDVLVQDTRWGAAGAATIMRSLVAALSERSTHDPLTRLKTRAAIWYDLTRRCAAGSAGTGQFLLLFDIEGLHRVNAGFGLAVGDEVLVEVASRLVGALPAGSETGRVDGGTFAVVTTLPTPDESHASLTAESLRRRFAAALTQPPSRLPAGSWPPVRVVVAWSTGPSSAERLVLDAEARMRDRRRPFA